MSTPLCAIMRKYGSDKGTDNGLSSHNYTLKYNELFKSIKQNKLRIFELGLGTNYTDVPSNMGTNGKPGASLYGWAEYFNNSTIFGADIDKRILFNTNRIKTFYCDQTNPTSIHDLWENDDLIEKFDIIIEDGLHSYSANICFLENSIHKININGYYIIEDILQEELPLFNKKIVEYKDKYPNFIFETVVLDHPVNNINNYGNGANNILLIGQRLK